MHLSSKQRRSLAATATAALVTGAFALAASGSPSAPTAAGAAAKPTFSDPRTIDNPYLPLTKWRRCEYRGELDDGTKNRSVLTRLDRTKRFVVDGKPVDVAVFRDKAFEGGQHIETAFDYFAQSDDGTVYYFGENVYNLENGHVVDTNGTWLFGKHTDVLGVAMPTNPQVGDQYRFEDVPGITTESNRIEETGMRADAAGQRFTEVIRIQEFIQPEGDVEYKLYAPGTGKITEYPPDGRSELANCR